MRRVVLAFVASFAVLGVPGASVAASAVDTTPPTVVVVAPVEGAFVSGWIRLNAIASDDVAVTQVKYYVDSVEVAQDSTAPDWSEGWSSTSVPDGPHVLAARARDAAGNWGTSPTIAFTIDNGVVATPPSGDPTIAAAGDIAGSGTGDEATALLLDRLAPNGVLTLGDNAYSSGTAWEFATYYDPTWGRHKAETHPAPGNHEYLTAGASGYFGYFGAAAGDPSKGYYSFEVGAWHLIALNSEIAHGDDSAQLAWLQTDLAAHPTTCTLAYWHKPRFSDGTDNGSFAPFWRVLYQAGADVVLAGHEHNYQRLAPLNPSGALDTVRGIREFVVGTGGRGLYPLVDDPLVQAGNATTHGVLELTLHAQSYDWRFVPEAGQTYTDSGSETCN